MNNRYVSKDVVWIWKLHIFSILTTTALRSSKLSGRSAVFIVFVWCDGVFFRYDHVLTTFFEHVQSSTTSSASMETISRPYRFLLRSYNVVQSSCCVHPIFVGRSGNVAGVTEVYILCHSMAAIAKGLENIIMFAKISKYRKYQKYDIFWYFLYFW